MVCGACEPSSPQVLPAARAATGGTPAVLEIANLCVDNDVVGVGLGVEMCLENVYNLLKFFVGNDYPTSRVVDFLRLRKLLFNLRRVKRRCDIRPTVKVSRGVIASGLDLVG